MARASSLGDPCGSMNDSRERRDSPAWQNPHFVPDGVRMRSKSIRSRPTPRRRRGILNNPLCQVDICLEREKDPFADSNVTLGALVAEKTSCDASTEPERCSLLSALLNRGAVQAGEVGNPGL